VARCDQMLRPNYDLRISAFYEERRIDCWYTVPSLVEHRPVKENPSLVKMRTGSRQAWVFEEDPAPTDWRGTVVRRGQTDYPEIEAELRPRFERIVREKDLRAIQPVGAWVRSDGIGTYTVGKTIIKGGRQYVDDPFVIDRLLEKSPSWITVEGDSGKRFESFDV
jgi:hypothetical protein